MMKSRSQKIAIKAFARIKDKDREPYTEEAKKKYATLVHKLPAMLLQNGLTQTTGFLLAKKNEAHHSDLLTDLRLIVEALATHQYEDNVDFHEAIIHLNLPQTLAMTRNVLAISGWLRRYVQGVWNIGPDGEDVNQTALEEK